MSLADQLAAKLASGLKPVNRDRSPAPMKEKPVEQMSLAEQLAYSAARLKSKNAENTDGAKPAQRPPPREKPLEQMSLQEQLEYSRNRLKSKSPIRERNIPPVAAASVIAQPSMGDMSQLILEGEEEIKIDQSMVVTKNKHEKKEANELRKSRK